jgi:hypothetical protein
VLQGAAAHNSLGADDVSKRDLASMHKGRRCGGCVFADLLAMYYVCVVLVSWTRARLFTFDRAADEAGLVEHPEIVIQRRPEERLDRRCHGVADLDGELARVAMAALRELVDKNAAQRVVICADPPLLRGLRAYTSGILSDNLPIEELARELIAMSPAELRSELAAYGLLPPRAPSHR